MKKWLSLNPMTRRRAGRPFRDEVVEKRKTVLIGLYPTDQERLTRLSNDRGLKKSEVVRRALEGMDD